MDGIGGYVTGFVLVTVLLVVTPVILSGVQGGVACTNLEGYDGTQSTEAEKYKKGSWAAACMDAQKQSVDAFGLLTIILVLIAAGALVRVIALFV